MSSRFKVVEGSQSCHCCFDATVVDTTKPTMHGNEHYNGQYDSVCECFDDESATMICDALNAADRAINGARA